MSNTPRSILVTGSSGAVGTRIVEALLARDRRVVAYDRRPFEDVIDGPGTLETVQGDVSDQARLAATLESHRVEAVVHAAAILPGQDAAPTDVVAVNVQGAAAVAGAANIAGVRRLVFTSTKGVYDDFTGAYGHPTYRPITEDHPVIGLGNTHTLYNVTKLSAEYCLAKISDLAGVELVVLRFATMYGPKRRRHGTRSMPGDIVESMASGDRMRIVVGGDQFMDLVYIKDVARSVVCAIDAEAVESRVYNVGSGTLVTLQDVADSARAALGHSASVAEIGPGLDPMRLGWASYGLFDISRARRELSYRPAFDLRAGVADYVAGIQSAVPAQGRQ